MYTYVDMDCLSATIGPLLNDSLETTTRHIRSFEIKMAPLHTVGVITRYKTSCHIIRNRRLCIMWLKIWDAPRPQVLRDEPGSQLVSRIEVQCLPQRRRSSS